MKNRRTNQISRGMLLVVIVVFPICFASCSARERHRTIETQTVQTSGIPYTGPKHRLVIGDFTNRSPFMSGVFSDNTDRLGAQARQILMTHLSQSGRFTMLSRSNLDQSAAEAAYAGKTQRITGANVILGGAVTEFGRKEVGRLDSIFHRSRTQVAYAKVMLSVEDMETSQVLFTSQGAGEFDLTDRGVLGFGSVAGYDATLADKVLSLAIMEAVEELIAGLERGEWSTVVE